MSGNSRLTSAMACGTRLVPGLTTVPIEAWPMRPARSAAISSCARPISDIAARARRISTWPYQVGSTPRACRSNSFTPSMSSISASNLDAAGCVMLAASAARSTERCSCKCSSSKSWRVLRRAALNQGVPEFAIACGCGRVFVGGIEYAENFICSTYLPARGYRTPQQEPLPPGRGENRRDLPFPGWQHARPTRGGGRR